MPAPTEKARKYFGVQLAKKRAGKKTDVDMSEAELAKMASKPKAKKKGKK